ncbi:MAG: EAL domain-containing protein [Mycobacteriales bacterium]|nr:EAL domain-containing protein [Mycobacteriales bacterium]
MVRRALSSLTVRFAVVSGVLVALLGLVLQLVLGGMIERRALADAKQSAAFVTDLVVSPVLAGDDLFDGLSEQSRQKLDVVVATGLREQTLRRIKLFDAQGTLVFSDDPKQLGRRVTGGPVGSALAGSVGSDFADTDRADHAGERGLGSLLEVFAPVHAPDGQVIAVAELYVPYDGVAAGIARDGRQLLLLLLGGLGLLWVVLYRLVARAARQLQAQVARNEHQAMHDALTGLPNRTLLFDRAERALARDRREQRSTAVLLLDLDRFKEVNDTLGHHNGDRLLCEVAVRLQSHLRAADSLARLGGDEFAVLLPGTDEAGARVLADRLTASLHEPVDLDGLAIAVGASIGIAVSPDHGADAELLLQRADVAMYAAKQGAGHVSTYSATTDTYSPDRLALLAELRRAIAEGEMRLHFQPKSDVSTGALVGFEALCRWQHPTRGILAPDVFIPLAENSGLISELTPWVLEHALRAARSWGDPSLSIAINISVRNLVDDTFPEVVARVLADSGVAPDKVVLEITESSLMSDPETSLGVLRRLKALGVRLAVDDYGSGYSSLAYLQQLPVDELKIDRGFVRDIAVRDQDRAIVRSTVELGRSLGLVVVAEGVEDAEAWSALEGVSCDQLQGYFLARPLPESEVAVWIEEYVSRPARLPVQPALAPR